MGVLRFPSAEQADRAYTLFNGASLKNGIQLQLRINPPGDGCQEPEATSGILQIRNLPLQTTNHFLYNLFRPFGPMSLCKVIMDQDRFKGTALIQYFDAIHADTAVHYMASGSSSIYPKVIILNLDTYALVLTEQQEHTRKYHVRTCVCSFIMCTFN